MCKKIYLTLTCIMLLSINLYSQEPAPLFTGASERSLNASQTRYLNAIKNRRTTATYKVVKVPSAKNVGNTANMVLHLKSGLTVQAKQESIEKRSEEDFTWLGKIEGRFSQVTLSVNPGGIFGTIWVDGELYRIESLGGDKHAIVEIDQSKFGNDHPPGFGTGAHKIANNSKPQKGTSDKDKILAVGSPSRIQSVSEIDVMVVYTPAVAAAISNISGLISQAESETITSFSPQNSNANVTIDVVYKTEVNYNESNKTYSQHLNWLDSDAAVDYMRDEVGADLVVLLVDDTEANGLSADIPAGDSSEGFAAVYYDAATGYYSFGHEIGHLHGAHHQWAENKANHERHGYSYESDWRTIMVTSAAGTFPRIQYWSNPLVDHPVDEVPMGTTDREDNVGYALNVYGSDVSAFLPTGNPSAPAAPTNLDIPNEAQVGENPELTWTASPTL